jgi:hypothetical protein
MGDTIVFAANGTLNLASALTISKGVTLVGNGATNTVVNGQGSQFVNSFDAFDVTGNAVTQFSGIKVQNAYYGIRNQSTGSLTVTSSTLFNNLDGIMNDSTGAVTVTYSILSDNTGSGVSGVSSTFGGASGPVLIANVAFVAFNIEGYGVFTNATGAVTVTGSTFVHQSIAIYNDNRAIVTITNTTFSNNDEAIYNYSSDKTTVANSTFSGNRYGIYSFAPMTVENTIIAASTTDNCNGTISDGPANNHQGHNLEYGTTTTASSCGFTTTSANPMLGPLIDNGGPTQTFALPPVRLLSTQEALSIPVSQSASSLTSAPPTNEASAVHSGVPMTLAHSSWLRRTPFQYLALL